MPRIEGVIPGAVESRVAISEAKRGGIILALMSELSDAALSELSTHLEKEFGAPVETVRISRDVSFAYNRKRKQYSSPRILDKLRKIPQGPQDKILGIVDVDLFCPDYDFVFGEAELASGIATLSTYRLKEDTGDAGVILSRIVKEATHEIGHLFNMGHCEDPNCVMSFSTGNLSQIDSKTASTCQECLKSADVSDKKTIPN